MQKKILGFVLLVVLLPSCALADTTAMQLNKMLSQVNSLTAKFNQQVISEDGTDLQNSNGSVAISRPGKFRWVTLKPMKQVIITNGSKLWIYEPDLDQVTIRTLSQNIGQTPLLLLTSKDIVLQKSFIVKQLSNQAGQQQYELLPKGSNDSFKQVIISFNQGKIAALQLLNQLNQTTKIQFSQLKLNSKLPANLFTFKVPPHVDVVDLTKK